MKPKIKETHDYITISFINGNFTCGRRGYRASGSITDKAFKVRIVDLSRDVIHYETNY